MAKMEKPLAMVTGAARRLGRAFALSLARQGYAIFLHYNLSNEEAAATEKEITAMGIPVYPYQADLTSATDIEALFSYLDTLPNPLRILVNSAALMPRADIRTLPLVEWDKVMALNLRAPFVMAQQAALRMKEGGLIVNITDAGASKAWTGFPAYSVSKVGLEALMRVQAKAFAPKIRVNAIAPGLVLPAANLSPEDWNKLVDRLPLKRSTSTDEITSALEFLIDNQSITGQTIIVDGGFSLT